MALTKEQKEKMIADNKKKLSAIKDNQTIKK